MTNQRVIGTATSVEVQLTPAVKVAASVLAADRVRDVAILWIDPKAIASVRPVPLACGDAARTPVAGGAGDRHHRRSACGNSKGMTSGRVTQVDAQSITADFLLPRGSAGARSSPLAAAWLGSPRSRTRAIRAAAGTIADRPHRRGVRGHRVGGEEDEGLPHHRAEPNCPWSRCGRFPWTRSRTRPSAAPAA